MISGQLAIRAFSGFIVALLALGPWLPNWALFLITVSAGKGLVVLGLLALFRAGLVSFGQGLYYCIGAYTVGLLGSQWGVREALILLPLGAALAALVALVLGFLLSRYRGIFFAMLSLAFSMILYGLLVKVTALGSTDGFNVAAPAFAGMMLEGASAKYAMFALACLSCLAAAWALHVYLGTPLGRLAPAIRDNEIRVEYLGASVRAAIHVKYVIAAALAGAGGALTAIAIGHVDPEFAYWTTSGEFVFVNILAGSGSVVAPFMGALIFESIRSFAYEYSPHTWQLALGLAMLIIIWFVPNGLWSVFGLARPRPSRG